MKYLRIVCATLLCVLLADFFMLSSSSAQVEEYVDTKEKRDVVLYQGDIVALKVYSLTRIAVSKPGIVEIVNADVDEILLAGRSIGQTQIFIWDEYGKKALLARVMEQDLDMVRERIDQLLDAAEITGVKLEHSAYEGKLIATGKVNKVQKEEFDDVIQEFGNYIINMVKEQDDLIQIDAQVTQLNTTLQKVLGVAWDNSFNIAEQSYAVNQNGYLGDIIKIGDIERTSLIQATVNALLSTSEAKTLSRPSVVVSDGEEASILVGGEVPIVSSITSDGAVSESVTYKNYGVELSVTPEIEDDDKIRVTINVSVRDLGDTFGDNTSFTTTTANTQVLLDDGQTVIIAGLIKQGESTTETKVPFLHRIPILGWMFKNRSYLKSPDQEIVISLTPHLRRQKNDLKTNREIKEEEKLKKKAEQEKSPMAGMDQDGLMLEQEGQTLSEVPVSNKTLAEKEENLDELLSNIEETASTPMVASEGISEHITEYAKSVQDKISQRISFPFQAKEEGWEGVVTLTLTILSDGTLNDASIKESSGYSVFDEDAINTAEIVAPFDPFPIEIEQESIVLDIPVAYHQQILDE